LTPSPVRTTSAGQGFHGFFRESLAAMRRASDELARLQGQSPRKDEARRTKRLFDDLGACLGR
jgi:hypothetical protein